jgi:hypothetical protein
MPLKMFGLWILSRTFLNIIQGNSCAISGAPNIKGSDQRIYTAVRLDITMKFIQPVRNQFCGRIVSSRNAANVKS